MATRTYNANAQTLTATLTALALGTTCTDGGATSLNGNAVQINQCGTYYIAADVIFTPTAAGTEVIQLYKDGVALPCAVSQTTGTAAATFTTHVETILKVDACNVVKPQFSVRASGTTGTVNFVGVSAVKVC